MKTQWQIKNSPCERKIFKPNSGKEKFPFMKKKPWAGPGSEDLPAKQLGKNREEEGDRTEKREDRERRGSDVLAILFRTKYINSNYPLAGELRTTLHIYTIHYSNDYIILLYMCTGNCCASFPLLMSFFILLYLFLFNVQFLV